MLKSLWDGLVYLVGFKVKPLRPPPPSLTVNPDVTFEPLEI